MVWDQGVAGLRPGRRPPVQPRPPRPDHAARPVARRAGRRAAAARAPAGEARSSGSTTRVPDRGAAGADGGWDVGTALARGQPGVRPDARGDLAGGRCSTLLAAGQIADGAAERAVSIAGGLHHAMRDRASGFCVYNDCAVADLLAAGQRVRQGRLRRHRRAPRRRGAGRVLRRPPGAHHLAAPEPGLACGRAPGSRPNSARVTRRGRRSTCRCRRTPATVRGCAASPRSCRPCSPRSNPKSW